MRSNMLRLVVVVTLLVTCCLGANIRQLRPLMNGRIVGGKPADITQFPYQVSFQFFGSHVCGAAIVGRNWVVTAAHCVDALPASSISFRAGSSLLEAGGSEHQASDVISHPDFDYYNLDSDIAVAKVSDDFSFGSSVQPIPIAFAEPSAGAISVVTGWGTTYSGGQLSKLLLQVSVPIVDHAQCDSLYSSFGGITKNMICAGEMEGGKDSCQGDSGGPLVVEGQLVGLVSWGAGCAIKDHPGIYSNVATLSDFILNTTTTK